MKTKLWQKLALTIAILTTSLLVFTTTVFAEDTGDSGSGSTGGDATVTTCYTATHVKNTEQCSDKYGGASWHIFSVNYPPKLNNNLDRVQPQSTGPTYNTNEKFMKDGGYDWAFSCPADEYDYYLAYVYDGWNGLNMTNGPVWYGPLQWQVACGEIGDHCNHPVYHTRNAYSYATGVERMRNGSANTLRITGSHPTSASDDSYVSRDALSFYKKYCHATGKCSSSASSIPAIGYFCIPKTIYYTPSSASSVIDIKVNGSDGPIYAKPGDDLTFKTTYNPVAQAEYNVEAQSINVDGEGIKPGGYTKFATLGKLFSWYSGRGSWGNSFTVSGNILSNTLHYHGTVGSTATFTDGNGNSHKIKNTDVGESSPLETAALTRNTPGYVYSRSYNNDAFVLATIDTKVSDSAMAAVPYNFENSTTLTTEPTNDDGTPNVAYAGETKKFSFDITTSLRKNNLIGDTYATIVRNAHTRLKICYTEGGCYNSEPKKINDLHVEEDIYSEATISSDLTINIPDINAGSEVCVQAGIYPKDSHDDKNIKMDAYDINDDNSWQYSETKCYTIAKRPSTQIWGGNVYSRGNLITSTAIKNNLAGYSDFAYKPTVKIDQRIRAFGSWGELGVISNGTISGFGSGASMGYASNNNGALSPNPFVINTASTAPDPGGSKESSFCKHIPLTIPNSTCSGNSTGLLSSIVSITKATSDKESIINLLASGSDTTNHNHYNKKINVSKNGENGAEAVGTVIESGATRVISSDDDITITTDLEYFTANDRFTNYSQIPKLIIYSKKNIYINCEVHKIDALLIANDTVVTCNNFENKLTDENIAKHINDPENSSQLMINGAIIANRLIANRTYGAATGANSIVPAEIINFDPTLYQFGGSIDDTEDETIDDRLDITRIREVPPRL